MHRCCHAASQIVQVATVPVVEWKGARLHCRPQMAILCMWPMWSWELRTLVAFVLKTAWCNHPHLLNPSHLEHNCWIVQRQTSQDTSDQDFFNVLKYTADCGNLWFRELYKFGVLIPSVNAAAVAPMAWGLTETRIIIGYFIPLWISCVFCQNKTHLRVCASGRVWISCFNVSFQVMGFVPNKAQTAHARACRVSWHFCWPSECMKCVHVWYQVY